MSRELQRTNRKICKNVTLYHWDPLKKRPSLGIFSIQSVIQGLNNIQMTQWRISLPWLNKEYFHFTTSTSNNIIHTIPKNQLTLSTSPLLDAHFRDHLLLAVPILACYIAVSTPIFPLLWRHVCCPLLLRLRFDWPTFLSIMIKLKAVDFEMKANTMSLHS